MSFTNLPIVNLIFRSGRTIEKISGFITIQEVTKNELDITQHPVEQGADITDHAIARPVILEMQIQFDRTNTLAALAGAAGSFIGNELGGVIGGVIGGGAGIAVSLAGQDVLKQTYDKLLALQLSRVPFSIGTPKKTYNDMLFKSLVLTTNKQTENVLAINAVFQQVIIVKITTSIVPRVNQSNPGTTGATETAGNKSGLLTGSEGITNFFNRTGLL